MLHLLFSPQHWAGEMMSRKGKRKPVPYLLEKGPGLPYLAG
jgi:hypothetical protein